MIREKINLSIREMTVVTMMIAIIVILEAVPGIPAGAIPVSIALQNIGMIIAGELFGPRLGTSTIWLFLFLAVFGLLLLSSGRGGMATILGPTGGHIFARLFVPLLIGFSLKLSWHYGMMQGTTGFLIVRLWDAIFMEGAGTTWLANQLHTTFTSASASNVLFVFGDTIKVLIAISITRRLRYIKVFC